MSDWFQDLMQRNRKQEVERTEPRLVAYYWDGAAPRAHAIREISPKGMYLITEARWYPGTVVTITLQRTEKDDKGIKQSVSVGARVVAAGIDGVAMSFVFTEDKHAKEVRTLVGDGTGLANRLHLNLFLQPLWRSQGQALIEYVLLVPLLFLLVVNMVNFGGYFFAWITVANAARAGADYAIQGGASANAPAQANATQISNVVTAEVASLPNNPSVAINICQNNNGTIKALSGSCGTAPAADPETASGAYNYVETWMDVSYTYVPLIAAFTFPALHIYATLPPTPIHRRAVMRMIQ